MFNSIDSFNTSHMPSLRLYLFIHSCTWVEGSSAILSMLFGLSATTIFRSILTIYVGPPTLDDEHTKRDNT